MRSTQGTAARLVGQSKGLRPRVQILSIAAVIMVAWLFWLSHGFGTWAEPGQDQRRQTVPTMAPTWPPMPSPSPDGQPVPSATPTTPPTPSPLPVSPEGVTPASFASPNPGETPATVETLANPTAAREATATSAAVSTRDSLPGEDTSSTPAERRTLSTSPTRATLSTVSASLRTERPPTASRPPSPSDSTPTATSLGTVTAPSPAAISPSPGADRIPGSYVALAAVGVPVAAGGLAWLVKLGLSKKWVG